MGSPTVLEVLLVEDDPGDVLMTQEALQRQVFANRLHVVNDGVAALRFLRRENGYADARRPDIILLDLNLPLRDGREVLAEVKSDPDLAKIPGRCPHHLVGGGGRGPDVRTARERVRDQAGRL